MKFSNSTNAFYAEEFMELYQDVPEDIVDVSEEDYLRFLNGEIGPVVEFNSINLITKVNEVTKESLEVSGRSLRNTLRNKLDNYLKPASTIEDQLVTEEQKTTLINDSLLLARWPATVGWPYISLPELSDTALDILGNPTWEFDKWK